MYFFFSEFFENRLVYFFLQTFTVLDDTISFICNVNAKAPSVTFRLFKFHHAFFL